MKDGNQVQNICSSGGAGCAHLPGSNNNYNREYMKVIIESPFAGDVMKNIEYARKCLLDSLKRGEYPLASHLLYTQVLEDTNTAERNLGIQAGLAWGKDASKTVVYTDLGISKGMEYGISRAKEDNREVEYRKINL